MKKFLSIIVFLAIFYFSSVSAKDNGSIEHIGGDTILSYNGDSITIHDEDINFNTQKCPIGYHIGTAEDWEKVIKLRWDIKGRNYKLMELESSYSISEKYQYDNGETDHGLYVFGKDVLRSWDDLNYKTASYGDKHLPYFFVFRVFRKFDGMKIDGERKEGVRHGGARLKTCDGTIYVGNSPINCNADYIKTRCFKDSNPLKNGYSKEYNDAYIFAYNNKITSMDTIEKANMYGEIKRMEIAKMLSNWVKNFEFYQDYSISCNFTDTSSVKGDLATAIIESCRYGIMGKGISKFRPYDKITKGEVATAISRILRGSKYDGGSPYYIKHINALKDAGILNNTLNAGTNELRGNVMTMIMKADDILKYHFDSLTDCNDISYINNCYKDERKCVDKCKK